MGIVEWCPKNLECRDYYKESAPFSYYLGLALHAYFAVTALAMALWFVIAFIKKQNNSNKTLKRDAKKRRAP